MPDALRAELGGSAFEVVAPSVVRGGAVPVRELHERTGVRRLDAYIGSSATALDRVDAVGLPRMLLIGPEGILSRVKPRPSFHMT